MSPLLRPVVAVTASIPLAQRRVLASLAGWVLLLCAAFLALHTRHPHGVALKGAVFVQMMFGCSLVLYGERK